jgi:hypothetical protein
MCRVRLCTTNFQIFCSIPRKNVGVVLTQPTDGNVIVYFENSPVNFRLPDAEYQVSQREFV